MCHKYSKHNLQTFSLGSKKEKEREGNEHLCQFCFLPVCIIAQKQLQARFQGKRQLDRQAVAC